MSPLIATVLLIAFAAAIGTMIINWSMSDNAPTQEETVDPCADIKLELEEIPSGEAICYDADKRHVSFLVTNSGFAPIDSLVVKAGALVNSTFENRRKDVRGPLAVADSLSVSLEYETLSPNDVTAEVIPVAADTQGTICTEKSIKRVGIPTC